MIISKVVPGALAGFALSLLMWHAAPASAQVVDLSDVLGDSGGLVANVLDPGIGPGAEPTFSVAVAPPDAPGGPPPEAFAGGPPGPEMMFAALAAHRGQMGGGPFRVLEGPLALTDEQVDKMFNLKSDMLDKVTPKMAQMSILHRHMLALLGEGDVDAKKVRDLQGQINSLRSDVSSIKTDNMIAMAQVLTADQRKAIKMHMEKACVMGCHGMGHHMHGGHFQHGMHK